MIWLSDLIWSLRKTWLGLATQIGPLRRAAQLFSWLCHAAWLGVFPVMGYPKSSKNHRILVLKPIGLIPHFESLMYTFHFESQRSRGVHHSPDGWVFQVAQSFGLLHGAKIHTRLGHMVDQPKWWMIIFNKCRRGGGLLHGQGVSQAIFIILLSTSN